MRSFRAHPPTTEHIKKPRRSAVERAGAPARRRAVADNKKAHDVLALRESAALLACGAARISRRRDRSVFRRGGDRMLQTDVVAVLYRSTILMRGREPIAGDCIPTGIRRSKDGSAGCCVLLSHPRVQSAFTMGSPDPKRCSLQRESENLYFHTSVT